MEEWRDIPGFEGRYQASDLGRVRSLKRKVRVGHGAYRTSPARVLKPGKCTSYGHATVKLGKDEPSRTVHSLVMLAFVGPTPPGKEIRHADTDTANCRPENLVFGTRSENNRDITKAGKRRVTQEQADYIRREVERGGFGTKARLARQFGMSASNITWIIKGKYYIGDSNVPH